MHGFGLIRDVALIQQDSFMYILGVYILFSLKAIHCDSWKLLLVIVFALLGQYFLGKKVAPILSFNIEEKKCEKAAVKSINIMNKALLYQNGSILLM